MNSRRGVVFEAYSKDPRKLVAVGRNGQMREHGLKILADRQGRIIHIWPITSKGVPGHGMIELDDTILAKILPFLETLHEQWKKEDQAKTSHQDAHEGVPGGGTGPAGDGG